MDHELGAAHIAAADRRIAEAEVRLMRMEELLAEMERDGHAWGLAEGRGLIATCERSLRVCMTAARSGASCSFTRTVPRYLRANRDAALTCRFGHLASQRVAYGQNLRRWLP